MPRPSVPILSILRLNARERLARFVQAGGPDECWLFTGHRNKRGYGFLATMIKGKRYPILAHRLAWVLEHGREVPDDKIICHSCNSPSCCNPKHLYLGTPKTNSADMVRAGRSVSTLKGVKGTAHPRALYTQEQRDEVIRLRQQAEPYATIQRITGVTTQTCSRWWGEWLKAR